MNEIFIDVDRIAPRLKIKKVGEIQKIYDPIRKRYFVLTPEEFVRQIFLVHLIEVLKYPKLLIQVEKEVLVNTLKKRFDVLVFNKKGSAIMLIECKNTQLKLTENVLEQAVNYNLSLKVPFLIITNGISTLAFRIDFEKSSWLALEEIPEWQSLMILSL